MSLTSFDFFLFLLIVFILYYSIKPLQKYILLFASLYFYIRISSIAMWQVLLLMFLMTVVTWGGALLIEQAEERKKRTWLALSISAIVLALITLKYAYNIASTFCDIFHIDKESVWIITVFSNIYIIEADFSWLRFAQIIGISYFSLSAIGYLVDVYWGGYPAERNIADVAVFVFWFPQLISGPVTHYPEMREQFGQKHRLKYENLTYGIRRMAWGYFKKLVLSERFGVIVSTVYGKYSEYSFIGITAATLCYAVQLYTDFSGCMDIIIGASRLFGIVLPENFSAPFFSETVREFWQRWHITLGTWFKGYVMYPLQKSCTLQKIGQRVRKRFGKKAGKKVPFYLSMFVLWFLIGIWHGGTGYYFIASAIVPFILLTLGDFCQPLFARIVRTFHINTNSESWRWFRRIRTLLLICICWVFVCAGSTNTACHIFFHIARNLWNYTSLESIIKGFGLGTVDMLIMTIGTGLLYLSDKFEYAGTSIFKKVDEQNFVIRVLIIYAEICSILLYGMVGSSQFIYFQF